MKAYVFPGQASQFVGMGKDMYDSSSLAKELFDKADEILGFSITEVMFTGTNEQLKQTKVTQPAVFLHSVIKAKLAGDDFKPDFVAGHSLGELSALTAAGALTFEDGLRLVSKRAEAMQKACEIEEGTMAAILGLNDETVERACEEIDELVIPANYNCPGQLVISGSEKGIAEAMDLCNELGAKRAISLPVSGAFHSELMAPAREELAEAINATTFSAPVCPIYQNVDAEAYTDPEKIKENLILQLTSPVLWTQTMEGLIQEGVKEFIEVGGTGKVIQGFVKKVDRSFPTSAL